MKRIQLTAIEIEAILAVSGDALPWETFGGHEDHEENCEENTYAYKMTSAYERARDKLEEMEIRALRRNDNRSAKRPLRS